MNLHFHWRVSEEQVSLVASFGIDTQKGNKPCATSKGGRPVFAQSDEAHPVIGQAVDY